MLPVSASPLCWPRHSRRHLWHRGRRGRHGRSKTGQGLGNTMGSGATYPEAEGSYFVLFRRDPVVAVPTADRIGARLRNVSLVS